MNKHEYPNLGETLYEEVLPNGLSVLVAVNDNILAAFDLVDSYLHSLAVAVIGIDYRIGGESRIPTM